MVIANECEAIQPIGILCESTEKVLSPFTSHFSQTNPPQPSLKKGGRVGLQSAPLKSEGKRAASRIIRAVAGVTSGDNSRAGFASPAVEECNNMLHAHTAPYRKFGFTLAEVFSKHRVSQRLAAFTLAEVLITLGIIGVVAAITMPTLIQNYQKHVWYNQFLKAASTIENAINIYNQEHGCGQKVDEDWDDNLCMHSEGIQYLVGDKLGSVMNVAQWITEDNYEEICAGYNKLKPKEMDGNYVYEDPLYLCANDMSVSYKNGYGFITTDGMLFNPGTDLNEGSGGFVDINGPDKGPNIFGRDIFVFYIKNNSKHRWGSDYLEYPYNYGNRLLQERKMNY